MKTFSPGLSDSIASVTPTPEACPHCDSSSQIAGGLCVGCLLETGLRPGDDSDAAELSGLLGEVSLQDQNWRLGNYEILEEIGRGGMGVIYRARQRHSRRIVAVKRVLSYHADSHETLARFRREAQAAASLDHPNILPIYEVSESEDGLPFFSMKFAPGGTLQQVAAALRNDPRQCVALVAKIARAVQYAHSRGILHRDLKPGNILLDGLGEPFVSDFGLAKWLDTTSDLTRTLTIFGTPGYIAPEQANNDAADLKPTADVYSLGAILFDLLASRPPFLGTHALSVIRQASESTAPKLRTLSKLADRDLETICSRCLEREPTARYRSAHDLAEDLERWLEGRPIIARPVLPSTKLWRWAKRNKLQAIAACTFALLAGVTGVVQFQRTRLSSMVQHQATAQHSVAVLPMLDLDAGLFQPEVSEKIFPPLQAAFDRLGPGVITFVSSPASGALIANNDQVAATQLARTKNVRALLAATRRIHEGKARYCFRLVNGASGQSIYRQIIEVPINRPPSELPRVLAKPLYAMLDVDDWSQLEGRDTDPGLQNERAKELILAAKAQQERRTALAFDNAIEGFQKVTGIEPRSALAFSLLAITRAGRFMVDANPEDIALAEKSAAIALKLNPELSEAHRARAMILEQRGAFRDAIEEVLIAYELNDPSPRLANLAARLQRTLGRPNNALAWYEIAAQSKFAAARNDFIIGDCWADLADDARAATAYNHVKELFPYLPEGWMGLCRLALLQQDFAAAQKMASENWTRYPEFEFSKEMAAQTEFFSRNLERAETLYRELAALHPDGGGSFYGAVSYQSALGRLRIAAGDARGGEAILRAALHKEVAALQSAPHHPEILYRVAAIEASLGFIDAAFDHLRAAVDAGWIDYRSAAIDPRFDGIRSDDRFSSITKRLREKVAALRTQTNQPASWPN